MQHHFVQQIIDECTENNRGLYKWILKGKTSELTLFGDTIARAKEP